MKIISEYNHNKHFHYYLTDNVTGEKTYYCNRTEVKPMTKVTVIEQTVHMKLEEGHYFTWESDETAYTNKKGNFNEIYNDMPDLSKIKYNVIINDKTKQVVKVGLVNRFIYDMEYNNIRLVIAGSQVFLTMDVKLTATSEICPKCGSTEVEFNSYHNHSKLVGTYLFNNEHNIKYTSMYNEFLKLRNGEVHTRHYKDMTIFDKKTGRIYSINNVHVGGSGVFANKKSKIMNSTYDNVIPEELAAAIQDYYMEQDPEEYTYTFNDLTKLINEQDSKKCFVPIAYIKRYLAIKNTALALFLYDMTHYDKTIVRELKGKSEKEILMYLKVAHKDITQYFSKRDSSSDIFMYCLSFRYMNKSYIKQMLIHKEYEGYFLTQVPKLKRENFIHQYAKHNGEKRLFNQLNKVEQSCLIDSISMYRQIKQINRSYELNFNNSIETIHDILSKGFSTASTPNKKIAENKELKAIFKDFVHNGISYRLAKTTHELIDVGNAMNICVGSYGERALKKQCYIVIGYDTNNNPVTCIEINKYNNTFHISQAKKKHNQRPDIEERQAIVQLCNDNNITVSSCDLKVSSTYKGLEQHYAHNEQENLQEFYF